MNSDKSEKEINHDPEHCPTTAIPKDNPFRSAIVDLLSDGHSYHEVWELLEEAYNPVDQAAFEENYVLVDGDGEEIPGEEYPDIDYAEDARDMITGSADGPDEVTIEVRSSDWR